MCIRDRVQVVPLARVAGAMLAVNWAATGSPFRFSLSLLQAASARAVSYTHLVAQILSLAALAAAVNPAADGATL